MEPGGARYRRPALFVAPIKWAWPGRSRLDGRMEPGGARHWRRTLFVTRIERAYPGWSRPDGRMGIGARNRRPALFVAPIKWARPDRARLDGRMEPGARATGGQPANMERRLQYPSAVGSSSLDFSGHLAFFAIASSPKRGILCVIVP
jgi:hypothetical protein